MRLARSLRIDGKLHGGVIPLCGPAGSTVSGTSSSDCRMGLTPDPETKRQPCRNTTRGAHCPRCRGMSREGGPGRSAIIRRKFLYEWVSFSTRSANFLRQCRNPYAMRSKPWRHGFWVPVEAGAAPAIATNFKTNRSPTSVDPGLITPGCPERYRGLPPNSKEEACVGVREPSRSVKPVPRAEWVQIPPRLPFQFLRSINSDAPAF